MIHLGVHSTPEPLFAAGSDPSIGLTLGVWPAWFVGVETSLELLPMFGDANTSPVLRAVQERDPLATGTIETRDPLAVAIVRALLVPVRGEYSARNGVPLPFQLMLGAGAAIQVETVEYIGLQGEMPEGIRFQRPLHLRAFAHALVAGRLSLQPRVAFRANLALHVGVDQLSDGTFTRRNGSPGFLGEADPCASGATTCRPSIVISPRLRLGLEFALGGPRVDAPSGQPALPVRAPDASERTRLEFSLTGTVQGTPTVDGWVGAGLRGTLLIGGRLGLDIAGVDVLGVGGRTRGAYHLSRIMTDLRVTSVPQGQGELAWIGVPLRGFFSLPGPDPIGEVALHLRIGAGVVGTEDLQENRPLRCPFGLITTEGMFTVDPECTMHKQVHPMVVGGVGVRWILGGLLLRLDGSVYVHPEEIGGATLMREVRVGARGGVSLGGSIRLKPRS